MKTIWAIVGSGLLLVACGGGSDDEAGSTTAPPAAETTVAAETTAPETEPEAEPTTTVPDPCTNAITLTDADGNATEIDVVTAWADAGPHPANTVDYDRNMELAIASYEIPVDPQFGLGIPVGVPEVPDGDFILTAYLSQADETIAADQSFADTEEPADPSVAGYINNIGVWVGAERINPLGATTITITELTDDRVCGTIEGVASTDIQVFPTVSGTFVLDRIQALEATD